jgi:hypothetical protein
MTEELEREVHHLKPLLNDVIRAPFTTQISSWHTGIAISITINGLDQLSIGFIDDKPDWCGYNPATITKATVSRVESAIQDWIKNIKNGVYARERATTFTSVIREELIERTYKPSFDSEIPP